MELKRHNSQRSMAGRSSGRLAATGGGDGRERERSSCMSELRREQSSSSASS
jgi:hypothetical protein